MNRFAAVDVGASGGRVMAGLVSDGTVRLEEVHRFPNGVVERDGHLRWDLSGLFAEVRRGLAACGDVQSIGIDTWGVDYGLLDADGNLLADPIAYRDDRTAKVIDDVHERVPPPKLYATTGIQFLPFNTIYQLAAENELDRAAHALLLPDLLAFWLTHELGSELTNASTTGLLDVRTRRWSTELFGAIGVRHDLFPPVQHPGEERGRTLDGTVVTTVGSHDTASAVVGVPATCERFAYIASGTWSLVGLELPGPVVSEEARLANFTNERGVDGRIRFLRNVGGLWLLQECLRAWGPSEQLSVLLEEASALPSGRVPLIDADDAGFIPPGDMPDRIVAAAGAGPMSAAEVVRCVLESLAAGHGRTLRSACALSGRSVEVVHVVGGGSQNALLCQLTADACGVPVVAGPVEATALGNVIVQARSAGALPATLEEVRVGIASSVASGRYEPR